MAYDKLCDSSVLDAGLKQIADAIREKGGTSDNLAFPAGMAEAIAAITAVGGNVELGDISFFETGYVTPSEDLRELPRTDPDLDFEVFAITIANRNGVTLASSAVRAALCNNGGWAIRISVTSGTNTSSPQIAKNTISFSDKAYLQAGVTYKYVYYGWKGEAA